MSLYIRDFDSEISNKTLLGSKGAGLVQMSDLNLPVPFGFIITTDLCKKYYANNRELPQEFEGELLRALKRLEAKTDKVFGKNLYVSVRSGSVVSMPGMMDTVLNVDSNIIDSVKKVLDSWMCERATSYRSLNNIPNDIGTAVIIQSMVFGDKDSQSGTGVVFTRSPVNGEKELYGEFLRQAQGEELVSGTNTPSSLSLLSELMPQVYGQLKQVCELLESYYNDMQDIEFTVESGKLYILQTRSGKRSVRAAIKVAVDMVCEGKISQNEALMMVEAGSLNQLFHSSVDNSSLQTALTKGLPASPGAITGKVAFSNNEACKADLCNDIILVKNDTSPEDIQSMSLSAGLLTACGGMTSHAAVIARSMGRPCVSGAGEIKIENNKLIIGKVVINEGDEITIDGGSGCVYLGRVPMSVIEPIPEFEKFMEWADAAKKLEVRANADTAKDTKIALQMGASGIGLCRTEHMFFEYPKLNLIRKLILAESEFERSNTLNQLKPLHKEDFKKIFCLMHNLPVTVRLLDPPLHEFLPKYHDDIQDIAKEINISEPSLKLKIKSLQETNPMLGFRGSRIGVVYPEIYLMQIEAVCEALNEIREEPAVEIMLPFIANIEEFKIISDNIKSILTSKAKTTSIGTMIELPRAALRAGEIARQADFFSFGTNDLTQTVYGISRDDVSSFMSDYIKKGIIKHDPFMTLDKEGVGELINMATLRAKEVKPELKIGICGEHGGDPDSIDFFHNTKFDYISCSAYRIPIARLAAAQAAIKATKQKQ